MPQPLNQPQLNKIYHADCLEFMKTLPESCIDLVVSDPPYNDLSMFRGNLGKTGKCLGAHGWFKNDQVPEEEFNTFFLSVLAELKRILKPDKHIYIFCNHKVIERFKPMFTRHFHYVNLLVWDKLIMGLGWCYRQQYELILLGSNGKRNKIKVSGKKSNVLRFKRHPNNKGKHPTQKPESIVSELISGSSNEEELVFDPFMGSGTTAVAAAKLKRNFLGCELESKYIQMANLRLAQLLPRENREAA